MRQSFIFLSEDESEQLSEQEILDWLDSIRARVEKACQGRKIAVIIRQSRIGAALENIQSREFQESMERYAIYLIGDPTRTGTFDEGDGVSGQKRIDERPEMDRLNRCIAQGEIGAVMCAKEDRLFRDKYGDQAGTFSRLLAQKGVLLLSLSKLKLYDIKRNPKDLEDYNEAMKASYDYIAIHIEYMIKLRLQKRKNGYWSGGALCAPFVIDKQVKKELQKPLVYEPWRDQTEFLFRKFIECAYSPAAFMQWVRTQPYLFREPDPQDQLRYLFRHNYQHIPGVGYTFHSRNTVRNFFTNFLHLGYSIVDRIKDEESGKEKVILGKTHEPSIRSRELFEDVYEHVTGHTIHGTPVPSMTRPPRRKHARLGTSGLLLHGRLGSPQGDIYSSIQRGGFYGCYQMIAPDASDLLWSISSKGLDQLVADRLMELAQANQELAAHVRAFIQKQMPQKKKKHVSLDEQLITLRAELGILVEMEVEAKMKNDTIKLALINEKQQAIQARMAAIRAQQQKVGALPPEETIPDFYELLARFSVEGSHAFNALKFPLQYNLLGHVMQSCELSLLSPHLYSLKVCWLDPVRAYTDVALVWRLNPAHSRWAPAEDEQLRDAYPSASQLELMQLFPTRPYLAIRGRAVHVVRVNRQINPKSNRYPGHLAYADLEAVERLVGENVTLREHLLSKLSVFAEEAQRGKLVTYWLNPFTASEGLIKEALSGGLTLTHFH